MTAASLFGVIALTLAIAMIELPLMLRTGQKQEIAVFAAALLAGAVLCGALALQIKLPNPLELLSVLYSPVYEWYQSLFS